MFPQFTKFHLLCAGMKPTFFFSLQNLLIVEEQLIHSALCQTIYNIHDQNVRVILLNFFSYQMYMIFLLALLPDRNTSPIVGQTYTME